MLLICLFYVFCSFANSSPIFSQGHLVYHFWKSKLHFPLIRYFPLNFHLLYYFSLESYLLEGETILNIHLLVFFVYFLCRIGLSFLFYRFFMDQPLGNCIMGGWIQKFYYFLEHLYLASYQIGFIFLPLLSQHSDSQVLGNQWYLAYFYFYGADYLS